jgi:hypothetical protein
LRLAALVAVIGAAACGAAQAAEDGLSFYLLGSRSNGLAGVTPPPGIFYQSDDYFYSGEVGRNVDLPLEKGIAAGVAAKALIDPETLLWVTPAQVMGGSLAFTATLPIGHQDVSAFLGPLAVDDKTTAIGDPVFGSFVGWHVGNFHWQTGVAVNVPVGQYDADSLANISFHRWAADFYGAATWLDPKTGIDISNTIGFTFNGENPATDYRTGTELHWEGAVTENFSKQFSAGVAGYFYDQITGDSGPGAKLGSFEGQTAAIGGVHGDDFQLGKLPVAAKLNTSMNLTSRIVCRATRAS